MRKKKRSDIDQKEVDEYIREFSHIFNQYPLHGISNMDETKWFFVYTEDEVLALTGTEEVNAKLPEDYRKQFTAIATISANEKKKNIHLCSLQMVKPIYATDNLLK